MSGVRLMELILDFGFRHPKSEWSKIQNRLPSAVKAMFWRIIVTRTPTRRWLYIICRRVLALLGSMRTKNLVEEHGYSGFS